MNTFTTTKLTKKQARALLRTMAQSLNESEARGDAPDVALSHAFGAPSASGAPREVLTRKLLGQCIRTGEYASGERAIGLRAAYRHEPASARWGAINTHNKGLRVVPTLDDAWKALDKLAQRYGIALARVNQGTGQGGGGAPVELTAGVTELTVVPGPAPIDRAQGTFELHRAQVASLERWSTDDPEPFPHAPMLARTLAAHTRAHERRGEDGDTLHSDAACALSLRLREPIMARHVRARSSVPCVQLLIDTSSSMNDNGGGKGRAATAAANSIAEACRVARVPIQVLAFHREILLVADWKERASAKLRTMGGTNLPKTLGTCLPWIASRVERRKIVLILTDGEIGFEGDAQRAQCAQDRVAQRDRAGLYPLTYRRRYADAHGIELYAIGLGVDVPHGPETFHGAIRIDAPEELCGAAARELARVIGRGERVAV